MIPSSGYHFLILVFSGKFTNHFSHNDHYALNLAWCKINIKKKTIKPVISIFKIRILDPGKNVGN